MPRGGSGGGGGGGGEGSSGSHVTMIGASLFLASEVVAFTITFFNDFMIPHADADDKIMVLIMTY